MIDAIQSVLKCARLPEGRAARRANAVLPKKKNLKGLTTILVYYDEALMS